MNQNTSFLRVICIQLFVSVFFSASYGDVQHLKAPSMALADSNRVILATPTTFSLAKKDGYPFIVMLHGWSGDETQWRDDAELQTLADLHNIILVLPDGGYDGWWIDTDLTPGRNYDSHIQQEIKIWIVENFNGSINPLQHGILGLSMGGFGAFNQALRYPDAYAAAASLSGVMDITRHTDSWHINSVLGTYSDNSKRWESSSPYYLALTKAPNIGPALLLICGRDDFTFAENQDIAKRLENTGHDITFKIEEGAHTHTFWQTHVSFAINFIVAHFK